jgi:signal recognition particle receptor subunit beta
LQGADAVAFIADSQLAESDANKEAFRNLRENLASNGLDVDQMPLVIQFNKRDLANIRSEEELRALETRRRTPIYRATAISGVGVLETLQGLLNLVWDHLDSNYALGEKLQTERQSFMEQVFRDWNPQRVRSSGFGS